MAIFPAHTPQQRNYSLGQVPQEEFRGEGGVAYQFLTGTIAVGQRLSLVYDNRPLAVVESIWDHYHAQQLEPFELPPEVWCGHTGGATIADPVLRWKYVEALPPERVSAGVYSLTVTLEAVGISIGATVENPSLSESQSGEIDGVASPALPPRPVPVPDPPVEDPIIVVVPPTNTAIPPLVIEVAGPAEIRSASVGFLDSLVIETAGTADLVEAP